MKYLNSFGIQESGKQESSNPLSRVLYHTGVVGLSDQWAIKNHAHRSMHDMEQILNARNVVLMTEKVLARTM